MAFMIALYCANHLAGGIPAILVKIPGSGGAAATTLDGYPMTQKGQAQQALVLCFTASVFGGLITTLATIALLPWLSQIGLYLRSVEMVVVMLFGLTLIAVIAAQGHAEGADRRLLRPADRRDRHRPHLQHAARHLRLPRALRRRAAGAGADRPVRDLRSAGDDRGEDDRRRRTGASARCSARWADTVEGLRMSLQKWWHIVWTVVRRPVHRHHAGRRREHRRVRRLPAVAPVVEASRSSTAPASPKA